MFDLKTKDFKLRRQLEHILQHSSVKKMESRRSSSSADEQHQHQDEDEYHEDDILPDLVLGTVGNQNNKNDSSSSLDANNDASNSSSVIGKRLRIDEKRPKN